MNHADEFCGGKRSFSDGVSSKEVMVWNYTKKIDLLVPENYKELSKICMLLNQ